MRHLPLASVRPLLRPANQIERNIRNVFIDGLGVGLVVGVSTFLPIFLARLGASSFLVGLITALPALTGALLAVPVGRFLETRRNVVPWYSGMRLWVLWSYVIFGLLPFIAPIEWVPALIIAVWAIATIPATFVNVAFTVVMGGVAGPRGRFALMSLRWSSLGVVTALTVALIGGLLDRVTFPLNYQLVFIGSFVGGLLSFLFSRSISLPDTPPRPPTAQPPQRRMGAPLAAARAALSAHPQFMRFALSAFVFRAGVAMAMPLLPLYWVREVGASDAWIGIINMAASGVLIVAYMIWSRMVRRFGNGRVLLASSLGMALYPIAAAATQQVELLALLAGVAGFMTAGNDLVNFDLVLSSAPEDQRATYIGIFQMLQNSALFILPLLGTLLGDLIGLGAALVVAGGLRLIGVGLFIWLGVGREGAPPMPGPTPAPGQ